MLDRRTFSGQVAALGLCACGCGLAYAGVQRGLTLGCFVANYAESKGSIANKGFVKRSGDDHFDFALAQTLGLLSDSFSVRPGFRYYEDTPANALATTKNITGHPDGTVMMGLNLLRRLRTTSESPAVAVATVCAHEFGHILQFKHGLANIVNAGQFNVKRSELQADYFAGYFTGLRKKTRASYPAASAALTQYDMGDTEFFSRDHHGTPQQRGAAFVQGFKAAKDGKGLRQAMDESTAYVMGL